MGSGAHLSPEHGRRSHEHGRRSQPLSQRSPERGEECLRRSVAVLADQLELARRLTPCSSTSLRLLLREIEDNARYLAGEAGRV